MLPRILFLGLLTWPCLAQGHLVLVEGNVNLRADPSTSNPPIRLLKPPEEALLLEHGPEGGYYRVRTQKDKLGWVWGHRVGILPEYNRAPWPGAAASRLR